MRESALHSDLVVMGHVAAVSMNTRTTVVKFQVDETFQGDPMGSFITIAVQSGKIVVDPTEPIFSPKDRAILFLYEDQGVYRCVNGGYGKKTIRNDNVYLNPENNFDNAKLKDYLDALREELQEKEIA